MQPLDGPQLAVRQEPGVLRLQVEMGRLQSIHGVGQDADALGVSGRLLGQDDAEVEVALSEHEIGRPRMGVTGEHGLDARQRRET